MHKKQRWYVVFFGRQVGIYESWVECHAHINRYPGALYKSYDLYAEVKTALAMHAAWQKVNVPHAMACHPLAPLETIIEDGVRNIDEAPVCAVGTNAYNRDLIWCIINVFMLIVGIVLTRIVYSVMGRIG